ncbi:MAG TPA: hypothetical protein VG298_00295, partial [Acidimicrobiales bacterium]|nr:hypothetical protein [Acidimicrobiales bacterium]
MVRGTRSESDVSTTPVAAPYRLWRSLAGRVKAKDPEHLAVKRSARAAVVIPSVFAVAHFGFSNPQIGLLAAFGSFALLLLVEFPGRPRTRLLSYLVLFVVGSGLISLGTVVSTHKVAAVVTMAVVGFAVLFTGIVTPLAATASTAALLVFVLPVAVAQPAAATGPRLIGWVLASAVSVPACLSIWRAPWHDNLRRRLTAAVSAVGRLAAAHGEGRSDPAARENVTTELSLLRDYFAATPYPPTGAVAGALALTKLVGRVEWVAGNAALIGDGSLSSGPSSVREVAAAVAETLSRSASLICDDKGHPVDDPTLVGAVQEAMRRLDDLIRAEIEIDVSMLIGVDADSDRGEEPATASETEDSGGGSIASTLDPSFQARALGIATEMVADAALESAGVQVAGDRRLGTGGEATSSLPWSRLTSHFSFGSVWFRNAVRGAA